MTEATTNFPKPSASRREALNEDFEISLPISLAESLYTYAIQLKANLELAKKHRKKGNLLSEMIELDLLKYEETRQRQLNGRRIPR